MIASLSNVIDRCRHRGRASTRRSPAKQGTVQRAIATLVLTLAVCTSAGASDSAPASPTEPLRVALTGKYPPFSFYSGDGELVGFDVDVSKLIANRLGRDLELVTTEWDGILAGLLAGKYDAIIGSMAITPERSKRVNFTAPYYISGAQLFVRRAETNAFQGIADLLEHRVGVGLGETYEHYLRSSHPDVTVVTYKSTADIFQDMRNERIDAFCTDRLVGLYQIKQGGMPFAPAGPLLYQERIAIPVTKDDAALRDAMNAALRTARQSGDLDALQEKWFSPRATRQTHDLTLSTELSMLARGFGITLAVAACALVCGFLLALPWGIGLHEGRTLLRSPLRFLNDFIRGTPVLIQLFFVYFGAPQIGITLSPIASAILTLSVSCAAYMAEALRSGLMAVDPGQRLAARALGLRPIQVFRFIIWPQAFRVSLPSLMNIVVAFIKDTALISIISVAEVIREAQSIISVTYNPMKYYFIVALMFFCITFPLMKLANVVERRIKMRGFQHD